MALGLTLVELVLEPMRTTSGMKTCSLQEDVFQEAVGLLHLSSPVERQGLADAQQQRGRLGWVARTKIV